MRGWVETVAPLLLVMALPARMSMASRISGELQTSDDGRISLDGNHLACDAISSADSTTCQMPTSAMSPLANVPGVPLKSRIPIVTRSTPVRAVPGFVTGVPATPSLHAVIAPPDGLNVAAQCLHTPAVIRDPAVAEVLTTALSMRWAAMPDWVRNLQCPAPVELPTVARTTSAVVVPLYQHAIVSGSTVSGADAAESDCEDAAANR